MDHHLHENASRAATSVVAVNCQKKTAAGSDEHGDTKTRDANSRPIHTLSPSRPANCGNSFHSTAITLGEGEWPRMV